MQSTLSAASASTERGGPTDPGHDEQLRRGIIATDVTRPVAWLLTLLFLAAIYGVPLAQAYLEKREGEDSSLADLFKRAPTAENLRQVEKGIEDASYAKAWVQPRAQLWLTRLGRVGNKLAVVGHDGWLYFTPGVLHVGGPGFLDRTIQNGREKDALDAGGDPIHANPLQAIVAFKRALERRGARLVLLPMPDKAALEPGRCTADRAPQSRPPTTSTTSASSMSCGGRASPCTTRVVAYRAPAKRRSISSKIRTMLRPSW